jgi:N-acetylmuramoyl-L-alanine amidase
MKINKMLIDVKNKKTRPGIIMIPRYITVHESNKTNKGADAFAHARMQLRESENSNSWHYTVDDSDVVYQSIPDNEVAWHVGDNRGAGDMSSIGIKICTNKGAIFRRAKYNAIQLIIVLMKKYSIHLGMICTHKKWTGVDCPGKLLQKGWYHMIGEIKYELDKMK